MMPRTAPRSGELTLLDTLDLLDLPGFAVARDRTVVQCNESAVRVFGCRKDEAAGSSIDRFLPLGSTLAQPALPLRCLRAKGAPFLSRIAVLPPAEGQPDLQVIVVRDAPPGDAAVCVPPEKVQQVEIISELSGIIFQPQHRHDLPHGRVEDVAEVSAAALDASDALGLAGLRDEGGDAGECGDGLTAEGAELGR